MLAALHGNDYIRARNRLRKTDITHGGREVSEYAGNTFNSTQTVGKDSEGRLIIQQTGKTQCVSAIIT